MTNEELVDVLRQALAERDAELAAAQAARDNVASAITALGLPPGKLLINPRPVAELEQKPDPPAKKAAPAKGAARRTGKSLNEVAAERATCPECGKECSRIGLGTHRRTAHGYRRGDDTSTSTSPSLAAVPDPTPTAVVERDPVAEADEGRDFHFECTACDATFVKHRELVMHTINRHERQPKPIERRPIPSEAAS